MYLNRYPGWNKRYSLKWRCQGDMMYFETTPGEARLFTDR
jgi:hypothetical protein